VALSFCPVSILKQPWLHDFFLPIAFEWQGTFFFILFSLFLSSIEYATGKCTRGKYAALCKEVRVITPLGKGG
jgi:hypothetical protein